MGTGLPGPELFPGQIVMRAKPLGEFVGEVLPLFGIANAPGSRRNRQHRPPVRPAVNRHSKSGPRTIRVTRKVELDHFGKLCGGLELPRLGRSDISRIRDGRWRSFIGRRMSLRHRIARLGFRRMASGNARSSEDVLRQRHSIWIAVVVLSHLRVPSLCQLGSSTISSAFRFKSFEGAAWLLRRDSWQK